MSSGLVLAGMFLALWMAFTRSPGEPGVELVAGVGIGLVIAGTAVAVRDLWRAS